MERGESRERMKKCRRASFSLPSLVSISTRRLSISTHYATDRAVHFPRIHQKPLRTRTSEGEARKRVWGDSLGGRKKEGRGGGGVGEVEAAGLSGAEHAMGSQLSVRPLSPVQSRRAYFFPSTHELQANA